MNKQMDFKTWMKEVKNIDVSILRMATQTWDRYLDEYNEYKYGKREKAHS